MGDSDVDLAELSERAKLLAEATGREVTDVMADLLDDGVLNDSNKEVMGILDKANEQATKFKALLMTVLPIVAIVLGGGGAEMMGITDFMGNDDDDNGDYIDPTWNMVWGCTALDADNYQEYATDDDGSCYWSPEPVYGCMNNAALNYDPQATEDDGTCQPIHRGCMDSTAENYDDEANEDDGSCEYPPEPIYGCTDPEAQNYQTEATEDDGSCEYPPEEPTCNGTANFYDVQTEWILENNNTTAKLEMKWDADWSCQETQYIEVDMMITNSSGDTVYSKIAAHNITGQDGTYITVYWDENVNLSENYTLSLSIWHQTDSGAWQNPENKTIALGKPKD